MSLSAGLVGLPNVGKSTLFNALTQSEIPAENYPFCTIDPHVACTSVPDPRLEHLQKFHNSQKCIPTTMEFVDIAGLVQGASSGEGLGNQFLSNIRNVDMILHVVRCFHDTDITQTGTHAHGDLETITTELILKDLESLEKRQEKIPNARKQARSDKHMCQQLDKEEEALTKLHNALTSGDLQAIRSIYNACEVSTIPLLSTKPFLIIANVGEEHIADGSYVELEDYTQLTKTFGSQNVVPVCAQIEHELAQISDPDEAHNMRAMYNLHEPGLNAIIRHSYAKLGYITFFTSGPKETRAWSVLQETPIRQAAGKIHSDLERGFICAEVYNTNDIYGTTSPADLKSQGAIRTEGQNYLVQDGDVINVRFNV